MKKFLFVLTSALAVMLILLFFLESGLIFFIHHPKLFVFLPEKINTHLRKIYEANIRNIIQLMPETARFDRELAYTLKPGRFSFQNIEFTNDYNVNHLGLRDDEYSLERPDIIILGDSFAMGWGVNQEETFARQLGRLTGLKVLNAGISSYGTGREMRLLKRLDRRNLKYLVIQYHYSDAEENYYFYIQKKHPIFWRPEEYQSFRQKHSNDKKYFPGKFSWLFFCSLTGSLKTPSPGNQSLREKEVFLFLQAINNSQINFSGTQFETSEKVCFLAEKGTVPERGLSLFISIKGVFQRSQIIVIELLDLSYKPTGFCRVLKEYINKEKKSLPDFVNNLQVLDLTGAFNKNDYYPLDGHLNKNGHRKVAQLLAEKIKMTKVTNTSVLDSDSLK